MQEKPGPGDWATAPLLKTYNSSNFCLKEKTGDSWLLSLILAEYLPRLEQIQ